MTRALDLDTPRPAGALVGDSLRLYAGHFLTLTAIGVAVVLPVELIASGAGLGQLGAGFHVHRPLAARQIPEVARVLVTAPLVAAAAVCVVRDVAAGTRPRAVRALGFALDAFPHVFVAVLPVFACGLLALLAVVAVGNALLAPLLLVPLLLTVRLCLTPQAVAAGGERRLAALRASWRLTRGATVRVFVLAVGSYAAFTFASELVASPLLAAARAADSGALTVAFDVVSQSLGAPAAALVAALLYFDLRTRARGGAVRV